MLKMKREMHTQHVDVEVAVDSDHLAVFNVVRDIPCDDRVIIGLLDLDALLSLKDVEVVTVVFDSNLVVLVGATIDNKDGLVVILLPSEDLGRGVDDVLVSHRIIADVDLGVTAVENKVASQLRDLNFTVVDSLDSEAVRDGVGRVVLGMPRDVELGRVGGCGRDGDGPVVRVLQRRVEPVCSQVRRGNVEEVGLQLDLAVLFAPELSLLGDLRAVVVRCKALCMAKVAPVGASVNLCWRLDGNEAMGRTTNHVNVEDRGSDCVVVLVEDALKLHVEQQGAVLETRLAPVLKTTALELHSIRTVSIAWDQATYLRDSVRGVGGDAIVGLEPVGGEAILWPQRGVLAVKPKGITIVAIDVDPGRGVWCDVALHVSLIVEVRDHNVGPAVLLEDSGPVVVVGHGIRVNGILVLVLRLEENDGPAIGDLRSGYDLANLVRVVVCGIEEGIGVGAQSPRHAGQPSWESASRHLSIDVGARTGQDVQASLLGGLEEGLKVKDTLGAEVARVRLEEVPVDVDRDAGVPRGLDLLEDVEPEARDGQSEGVELAAEDHHAFAIDEQTVVVPGDNVLLAALEIARAVAHGPGIGSASQGQAQREGV